MEVEKLQFKFYDYRTSLSMGKPFFSVFGSVEKSILGHYRCLEFSKLSFFFLRMMNWMQVHVNTQFEDIWILFDVVFRVKTLKNSLKWPFFEVFFVTIFLAHFLGQKSVQCARGSYSGHIGTIFKNSVSLPIFYRLFRTRA